MPLRVPAETTRALESLTLIAVDGLDDAALAVLLRPCVALTSLELRGCPQLTSACLADAAVTLPSLRRCADAVCRAKDMLGAYVREDNVRDKDKVWKARWGEAAACGRADELVAAVLPVRRQGAAGGGAVVSREQRLSVWCVACVSKICDELRARRRAAPRTGAARG